MATFFTTQCLILAALLASSPQEKPLSGPALSSSCCSDHEGEAQHAATNGSGQEFAPFVANGRYVRESTSRMQSVSTEPVTTPEAALAELEAGNARFIDGKRFRTAEPAKDKAVRTALASGQSPFAAIVACSDSRTMDNILFDQELGRVFSIRSAGNSPDTVGIASIEYAVEHLGVKVVMVMGHTKCGAVGAVADAKSEPLPDNLYIFQQLMYGLLDTAKKPNEPEAAYKDRLSQANAIRQAQVVYDRSKVVREHVDSGKLWLVPAIYDLATGKASFFKLIEAKPHAPAAAHH
jgi:carbonic anhydrase